MLLTFFQSSAVGWYSSSDEYSPSKYWEFRAATERNKKWGKKGTNKGTPYKQRLFSRNWLRVFAQLPKTLASTLNKCFLMQPLKNTDFNIQTDWLVVISKKWFVYKDCLQDWSPDWKIKWLFQQKSIINTF